VTLLSKNHLPNAEDIKLSCSFPLAGIDLPDLTSFTAESVSLRDIRSASYFASSVVAWVFFVISRVIALEDPNPMHSGPHRLVA